MVRYYLDWAPELTDDLFINKIGGARCIRIPNNSGFYPFGKVVGGDYYIVGLGPTCCWFDGFDIVESPFLEGSLG